MKIISIRATRGQGSREGGAIVVITATFLISIFLASCAANTGGIGSTAPAITVVDFRAQNVERLHDGVIYLVGDDSAGAAAKEYMRAFEEDLSARIPTQSAMPAPVNSDPVIDNSELSMVQRMWERFRVEQEYRSINNIPPDPKLLELKRYLDGRKMEAIGDLRRRNEAFNTKGDIVSAKMGLAASYVAISCANEPGEIETITGLVEPLLNALTRK